MISIANRFFIARSENKREPKKVIIAFLDGAYGKSKIPTIGTYKINTLVNMNIDKKNVAHTT